jgi:hypothetical protein
MNKTLDGKIVIKPEGMRLVRFNGRAEDFLGHLHSGFKSPTIIFASNFILGRSLCKRGI